MSKKKFLGLIVIFIIIALVAGAATAFFLTRNVLTEPTSFQECIKQRDVTINESFPRRCTTKSNKAFIENVNQTNMKDFDFTNVVKSTGATVTGDFKADDFKVIKTSQEWKNLIAKVDKNLESTNIDFDKELLVAVFMGKRSSGGFSIEITDMTEEDNNVQVNILEKIPAPQCFTSTVITSPYHIVKVRKTDKEFKFNVKEKEISCLG